MERPEPRELRELQAQRGRLAPQALQELRELQVHRGRLAPQELQELRELQARPELQAPQEPPELQVRRELCLRRCFPLIPRLPRQERTDSR